MLRQVALLLAVCAMLTGCVSNQVGTDFASVSKKVGPPRAGHARVPAGRHDVLLTELMFPGETKREIVMEAGRTHFYLIKSSPRHDAAMGGAVLGGLAGLAVVSVATAGEANLGPGELVALDEATARTKLAELEAVE
ncbi:hypothetical protein I6F34_28390 [Bradyrhizobium sp. BRP05]|nr:hypothetical protein [Bradyrhizobium sp. BRP05]MCA1421481.1 hypothetical protein [Bradyrhizobium sp. BRP23]